MLIHALSALALIGALTPPAACHSINRHHLKRDVNGSYIPTKAPRANIFAGISDDERSSILDFLNGQVGKTIARGIFFDAESQPTIWLLPPNKTEATSYLDGSGKQPARFARALGTGSPCFTQEYMVGPLPISNSTRVASLNYARGGNSTAPKVPCTASAAGLDGKLPSTSSTPEKRKRRFERRDPHDPYEEPMGWNGQALPHDDKAAPITILPEGARHEFDPQQNYVSWMDFTFLVSTGPAGVALYDVRFKGERIIYELGMQEALAHYAGPDYDQTFASYLDVGIGFTGFNLIPGYDCPSYATYTNAFCLFEFPKDFPINRHQGDQYHATKNIAFLVRSVSTVGNYDYQTTYEFYHDGSIQVIVRASGYIQGSTVVDSPEAWDYGFHIRDQLSGSMHDHVLNFKLDLDIHGTKNSVFKTEFVPHSQVYPWSNGSVINSMKVERSFLKNENEGKIKWAPNSAATYSVVNKAKKNELGENPGFKVYPSLGSSIHATVQNSSVFSNAINWATHPLYALQRKDSEPVSAHPRNDLNVNRPLVDFNDFFNGESLDQEDIVLYFNLGMHHMPDTHDLPNTVFTSAQSGMTIRPVNYLRSENSMSTRQQVDIANGNVNTYGSKQPSGSFNLDSTRPDLSPLLRR